MKNAIIAMVGMFILMGPAGGFVSLCMQTLFGGGCNNDLSQDRRIGKRDGYEKRLISIHEQKAGNHSTTCFFGAGMGTRTPTHLCTRT